MEIYQIDRSEVFPRLVERKAVYAINKFLGQNPFMDLRQETISEINDCIEDENWDFIVCERTFGKD